MFYQVRSYGSAGIAVSALAQQPEAERDVPRPLGEDGARVPAAWAGMGDLPGGLGSGQPLWGTGRPEAVT